MSITYGGPLILPVAIVIPFQVDKAGKTQLWFQKRIENGPLDGLLEWPGGKFEAGESPKEAALRELREETGLSVDIDDLIPFQNYSYVYPDRKVTLFVHLLLVKDSSDLKGGWINFTETKQSEFKGKVPEANEKILEDLGKYFSIMTNTGQWSEVWEI